MPTVPGLREIALEAIAAAADVPVEELTDDADLLDIGLDSVDFWTVLLNIEDRLDLEVPAEVLDRLAQLRDKVTVGELAVVLASWTPDPQGSGVAQA